MSDPILWMEFLSDLISTVFVAVGVYYGVRLVRLTPEQSRVAWTSGRAAFCLDLVLG